MSEKEEPEAIKEYRKGIELMKKPCLMKLIIDEAHKEGLVGEEDTIMALTIKIMLRLVKNSNPTSSNVLISDASGAGKDFLTTCLCNVLLKKNQYFHRSRLTEKVFTYWHAGDKKFTWSGKVIHLEDPEPELLNSQAFKVRASGETEETVVKKQMIKDIKTRGKPVIVVTSLQASMGIESVRRWDSCRIDTSKKLTKAIMRNIAMREAGLIDITPNKGLREALQNLQPKEVIVPYAEAIIDSLPNIITMRTQVHKLLDYIKASAVLHQHSRKKAGDKVIANLYDYEFARFCFAKFGNMHGVPLNTAEKELIDVLLQKNRPAPINDVLSQIKRGSSWLYEKIDRLKELGVMGEVYIEDVEQRKQIKHLYANPMMSYAALPTSVEIAKVWNKLCKNRGSSSGYNNRSNRQGLPESKRGFSRPFATGEIEGGFPAFRKCILLILNDSINKLKFNNYINNITQTQNTGKPPKQQGKEGCGRRLESGGKGVSQQESKGTEKPLFDRINDLREFIENNKDAGYKITYDMLTREFGETFIGQVFAKGILIRNGDEYICT